MPRRGPGGFHRCTCPRARKWGDAVLERESLAEPLSGARGGWGDVAFPFLVGGLLCVFNSRSPVAPPTPPSSATEGAAPRGSRYVLGWLRLQTALPSLRPFSCAGRWGGGAASAVQGGCPPRHPRGLTRLAPAARPHTSRWTPGPPERRPRVRRERVSAGRVRKSCRWSLNSL